MEEKQRLELNDDELEGVSGGGSDMPRSIAPPIRLLPDADHMPPGTGPCDPEYPPCDTYTTGITTLTVHLTEQKKTP